MKSSGTLQSDQSYVWLLKFSKHKVKGENGLTMKQLVSLKLPLMIVLIITLSGCGQVVSDSNFTLSNGESVDGSLFVLSQNAILAENSSVDGSVVMLCCNLTVEGEVNGDVFLLTGNVKVSRNANVQGDVSILTGNVSK